jgi:Protein of unknown function (DUF2911)
MIKLTNSFLCGFVLCAFATIQNPAQAQKPSPAADTSVTINGKKIAIKYSAPSMRGRKIYGDLVPYGKIWRAGADEATSLTTEADLDINGLKVPAGSYTLYVFPEANQWQLVVNKQTGQWGTVYNKGQDLGRVKMTLNKTSAPVETYKMTLSSEGGNKGKLTLEWENTIASVPFTVQ